MTIYYWKGATGADDLLQEHGEAVNRLLSGDYSASDLEKLNTGSSRYIIYSFRLSVVARLLFTTYKGCLHALEYLPTHDYQKSRFLKKGVLKQHLDGQDVAIDVSPVLPEEIPTFEPDATSERKGLDFYNQSFVYLSDEQTNVLQSHSLPLIISGEPGSGKTLVGTLLLAQSARGARKLYVTGERHLVDCARRHYAAVAMDDGESVDFKTYNECLTADAELYVGFSDFEAWLGDKKQDLTARAVYREFRICSGFTQEQYMGLGQRQSSISKDERYDFYELYHRYLSFLQEKIDPAFYLMEQVAHYDLIVVDEAQNLSLRQLLSLSRLARGAQVVYCLDPNQNSTDVCATRSVLEVMLHQQGFPVTHMTLNTTYRCSQRVAMVLNEVLSIKHALIGGKLDKQEAQSVTVRDDTVLGEFHILQPDTIDQGWVDSRLGHLAVVTTLAIKESGEAERIFRTPLVFTTAQIQGQEFHTVVAYQLLADAPDLVVSGESSSGATNRAKAGKGDNANAPWLASYFTACSRAMNTLVIVEARTKKTRPWLERFRSIDSIPESAPEQVVLPAVDWAAIAEAQRRIGNDDVAQKVEQKHLNAQRVKVDVKQKQDTGIKNKQAKQNTPPKPVVAKDRAFDRRLGERLFELLRSSQLAESDHEKIETLLANKSLNVNQKNKDGFTALFVAAYNGHSKSVCSLLGLDGIELNGAVGFGVLNTPLMVAAYNGHTASVIALLKHEGIEVNKADKEGCTALMYVAKNGQIAIVTVLLNHKGIEVNTLAKNNITALIIASTYGHVATVIALLHHEGIEVNQAANHDGATALTKAVQKGHVDVVIALLNHEGIDVNKANNDDATALTIAVQKGRVDIVIALLKHEGIEVNKADKHFGTGLMIASMYGHVDIVIELLNHEGIEVNKAVNVGATALMIASVSGKAAIVLLLLNHKGIEVNQTNSKGETALYMVLNSKHLTAKERLDVISALLGHEAVLTYILQRGVMENWGSVIRERLRTDYAVLFIQLIQKRERVWAIIKSSDRLGIDGEAHQRLLQNIYDSKDKLESEQHPLYTVLFKPMPAKLGLFQETSDARMRELTQLLHPETDHDVSYVGVNPS